MSKNLELGLRMQGHLVQLGISIPDPTQESVHMIARVGIHALNQEAATRL